MRTPWGLSDYEEDYGAGIKFYETPHHGGFRVPAALNARVPEYLRRASGWYEEDCDWAIVARFFPEVHAKLGPKAVATAEGVLKGYYPDEWERLTGLRLKPGESHARDEARSPYGFVVDPAVDAACKRSAA